MRPHVQIDHLVELGVNAVEVLPVFEYDELEFQRTPNPRDHMVNIWGYSHMSFFAPMARFASGGAGPAAAARQFKELVRALHKAGIEVILDVVYNHTVEGAHVDPSRPCLHVPQRSHCSITFVHSANTATPLALWSSLHSPIAFACWE